MRRVIDWCNVILDPLCVVMFAHDIYVGAPATVGVYMFAFLGVALTFLGSLIRLTND